MLIEIDRGEECNKKEGVPLSRHPLNIALTEDYS